MQERLPPQHIEAEQSVLGAMLLDQEAILRIEGILLPEDFYRESHKVIFAVIQELAGKQEAADIVTVTELLRRDNKLEAVGGIPYVTYLANTVPTAANIVFHSRIVAEKAVLRRLISAATEIASLSYEANEEVAMILDMAENRIMSIAENRLGHEFTPIKEIVTAVFEQLESMSGAEDGITGLSTGFTDFDRMTSGLQPSDIILLAARPSVGKTALALNITQHVALRKKKAVAFFSLEMSKEQLVQRLLCSEASVDSQRVRNGDMRPEDWLNLTRAANSLTESAIFIDETANITVMDLRAKARRLKSNHQIALVVIDYLQLMQGSGNNRNENRQQEITEISRSLKALAKELKIPVMALSQLSRESERRKGNRPVLSDLRESGSLEQDADLVAFLHRPDRYKEDADDEPLSDAAEVQFIIAKNRNGPVGTLPLLFESSFTRFRSMAKRAD